MPDRTNGRVLFCLTLIFLCTGWACGRSSMDLEILPEPTQTLATLSKDRSVTHNPSKRANGLIYITVDTLRADMTSVYGNKEVRTPNMKYLAQNGQAFWNAIAQSSTTTPSHASMFTGLYLHDHNVYSNFESLGDAPTTIAETLKGNGFETFAMVNMRHLNPEVANLANGFDTYIKSGNMRRAEKTVDEFIKWIDKRKGKPFFAWLHLIDTHTPYRPPAPYDRLYYDDDEADLRHRSMKDSWSLIPKNMRAHPLFQRWVTGVNDINWVIAQYKGAVTYVDSQIGRLIDYLDKEKRFEETAMVVTADHGECLGEHNMYFVHTGLYDSTIRVPLITYFPGMPARKRDVYDVVEMVDIFPTILEYFELPVQKSRGYSLLPRTVDQRKKKRIAYSEHAGKNLVALRSKEYKYIRHIKTKHRQPAYPFSAGKEELYDLRADPDELINLVKTHPDTARLFREQLSMVDKSELSFASVKPKLTNETLSALQALGYVR